MPGLAMHNFRGFVRSTVLFGSVNFFVGENSTGKTSVLSVLEILSSFNFFYSGDLISDNCDFSAFSDAASISENSPEEFSLGYFRASYSKIGSMDAAAFYFSNDNGRTKLRSIAYLMNGYFVRGEFKADRVNVSVYQAITSGKTPRRALEELMWGKPNSLRGDPVGKFTYHHKSLPLPSPLIAAMNVLALEKIKKNESDSALRTRMNPSLFADLHWGAPIRAKPEKVNSSASRAYSPEGTHIPSLIRRAYGAQRNQVLEERMALHVKNFGSGSHLFDDIVVKEYGTDHASPFEVRVRFDKSEHKLANVGYGVSQALPVLVQVASASENDYFVVQQPEVHLHPRAQAAFGDFFFEMATKRGHTFYIETHSDFLIDRFRLQMNKSRIRKKPTAYLHFFCKEESGANTVRLIPFNPDGTFPSEVPPEYKQFFFKEELSLLEIR